MITKSPCRQLALELRRSDPSELLEVVDKVRLVAVSVREGEVRPGHRSARGYFAGSAVKAYELGVCFGTESNVLAEHTFKLPRRKVRVVRKRVYPLLTTCSADPMNDTRSYRVSFSMPTQSDQ